MIKETLRILAMILLIMVIVMDDFLFYEKMKNPSIQLILAVIVIFCIFYDVTFGFIMGLVLLLIYYEIYKKIIITHKNKGKEIKQKTDSTFYQDNEIVKLDYMSEEHLRSAQNNVFDQNNFNTEIKGINTGFNNEQVYGCQGLDHEKVNFSGYVKENYQSY